MNAVAPGHAGLSGPHAIRLAVLLLAIVLFLAPLVTARGPLPRPQGRGGTPARPLTRPVEPTAAPAPAAATPAAVSVARPTRRVTAVRARSARRLLVPRDTPARTAAPLPASQPHTASRVLVAAKPVEGPDTR